MGTNESIRLRTEAGSSKNIVVKLNQEFDTIDFLSLKITQDEAYRNFCSDYGVVAGRVIANDGFGVSNAKISIFIPLTSEDQEDPIISALYPYFTPTDTNGDGVRYNLLPSSGKSFDVTIKVPNKPDEPGNLQNPNFDYFAGGNNSFSSLGQFLVGSEWDLIPEESVFGVGGSSKWKRTIVANSGPKTAVGTFPSKTKMLNNDSLLEIHEKYYKYTTKTNGSGDYMIFGVPTGVRTIHMDVDLSDIGGDSLVPNDFINLGFPQSQFDLINNQFKGGTNLDILPQIEGQNLSIDVIPFWGNTEQCEIGITRQDFNLTKEIKPSALLIFETFTNGDSNKFIKDGGEGCGNSNYGDNDKFGEISRMVNLGVGVEALAANSLGEDLSPTQFTDGKVLLTIPMYEKRKITNEFGDIVDGDDSSGIGIPTAGQYNVWVHSLTDNIDGDIDKEGFGSHIIDRVEYRYDFENGKKLIYTPGLWNAVGDTGEYEMGDSERNSLSLNTNSPGNNQGFPRTAYWGNKYRHAAIDDFTTCTDTSCNWPVCYGSLYFPRFEFRIQNNGDLLYCSNVVRDYSDDSIFGVPSSYSAYFAYQGTPDEDGDLPRWGIKGVLNITDILKFFKAFDGNLGSTSSDNWIFNNFSLNPDFEVNNIDRISNETYIFTSSKPLNTDGSVNYPDSLDKIAEPNTWINYNNKLATFPYVPNSFDTGTKSKEGRYMFYFGLKKNNTVLEKLKNYLGV